MLSFSYKQKTYDIPLFKEFLDLARYYIHNDFMEPKHILEMIFQNYAEDADIPEDVYIRDISSKVVAVTGYGDGGAGTALGEEGPYMWTGGASDKNIPQLVKEFGLAFPNANISVAEDYVEDPQKDLEITQIILKFPKPEYPPS